MTEVTVHLLDLCYLPKKMPWQHLPFLEELQRTLHEITGIRPDNIRLCPQP